MSSIFLSNNIIVYLFIQTILSVLLFIAFFKSIRIIKYWDFSKTTSNQYKLEKSSFLVILIISFALIVKIILFPYFTYSLDNLSNIVPGAMCAAGIVGANEFGEINLALKTLIIFLIGVWLVINHYDLKEKNYPYTKKKFILFIIIFTLFLIEFSIDILYLSDISTQKPVLCCSVIFGVNHTGSKIPFDLSISTLLIIFYLLYILVIIYNIQKKSLFLLILSIIFFYISYYSVTYFFSTYIYELPTHQCPFCMLQKEYNYIGYIIWSTLFLGIFFGIINFFMKLIIKKEFYIFYKLNIIFTAIFIFICTFYVLKYYIINGVFL